jgi:hypothetical protein
MKLLGAAHCKDSNDICGSVIDRRNAAFAEEQSLACSAKKWGKGGVFL